MTFHPVKPTIGDIIPPLPIADGGTNAISIPTAFNNLAASGGSMNSNKLTGLANGTAATDAAAFGQVPQLTETHLQAVGFGQSNSDTTVVANLLYFWLFTAPAAVTLTGLVIANGSAVAGNILAAIYSADGSALLASSASTAQSGTFTGQRIPFQATLATAVGTSYIGALLFSSGSARAESAIFASPVNTAAQGGFTLPSTVTPPITGTGPVIWGITY